MLSEPWRFHFPYQRTAGPVVGRFLAGLAERRVWGLRRKNGQVLVPPWGYDPQTGEALSEWVEVAPTGKVLNWTWIAKPLPQHPLQRPFAYGLIELDGATGGFFHVIDVDGQVERLRVGLPVRIHWAKAPQGRIDDIAAFVPVDLPVTEQYDKSLTKIDAVGKHKFDATFTSDYEILAGRSLSLHLRGLQNRKFIGIRGPSGNVYFPPNGADPLTGQSVGDKLVELPQTATVVRYCIVNIPVRGQQVQVPFAAADVLIDGADTTTMALIQGIAHQDVRLGLRVRAVWVDGDNLPPSMANVKWFEPTGEDDMPLEKIEAYL